MTTNDDYLDRRTDANPWDRSHHLLDRLLDQNDRLIDALAKAVEGSSATGIIAALNPPYAPERPETSQNPWEGDSEPHSERQDPWGDDQVTDDRVLHGQIVHGFIGPVTQQEPLEEMPEQEEAG